MTEIVAILEIIILLTCAVYVVFRVARFITQKKPHKLHCENCKYATKSDGWNAVSSDIEYYCDYMNKYHPPEFYCAAGEQRTDNDETD